jgi:hypothetical protein
MATATLIETGQVNLSLGTPNVSPYTVGVDASTPFTNYDTNTAMTMTPGTWMAVADNVNETEGYFNTTEGTLVDEWPTVAASNSGWGTKVAIISVSSDVTVYFNPSPAVPYRLFWIKLG